MHLHYPVGGRFLDAEAIRDLYTYSVVRHDDASSPNTNHTLQESVEMRCAATVACKKHDHHVVENFSGCIVPECAEADP